MAKIAADWSVDRATGNIRYIGGDRNGAAPSCATVIQLHRWLQDLSNDPTSAGNDVLPSSRAMDRVTGPLERIIQSISICNRTI